MRGPGRPKPLTKAEARALFMLDKYRLLTAEQAVRLGLAGGKSQVHRLFSPLILGGLIGHSHTRDEDVLSLMPRMHFLKPRGAVALEAATGHVALVSKRRFRKRNEVEHRRGIVDVHIALQRWATASGWTLDTFTTDFEPGSRGRHKATMLTDMRAHGLRYPPDAMSHVTGPDGKMRGLLIEYERGGARGDMSRFRREKLPVLRELAGGKPRKPDTPPLTGFVEQQLSDGGALPIAGAVRFLIVFEDAERRDKALAKWPEPASRDWRRFFMKSLAELEGELAVDWWMADGSRSALFPSL